MHTITCAHCGKQFQHENANVLTCSEACRKARKRNQDIRCKAGLGRTGQIAECRYCGKKYTVTGTTQKFCSEKCRKANDNRRARQNIKHIKATCIICGKEFMTSANAKAKTCGQECLLKYRSEIAIERNKKAKSFGINNAWGKYCMPCPWSTPGKLGAGPEGVSWYSAQCDPMTLGIWMTDNVETRREK